MFHQRTSVPTSDKKRMPISEAKINILKINKDHHCQTLNMWSYRADIKTLGNKCNRVKGHGITYPNDVIKKLIYNMNYRLQRKIKSIQQEIDRRSRGRCSIKTAVLENDATFTENACVGVSFLIKLQNGGL